MKEPHTTVEQGTFMAFTLMGRRFNLIGLALLLGFSLGLWNSTAIAESQGSDYKGITDPFGDPTAYEFAEDEKADKEFFHLGRFFMLGMDFGLGNFTGGLGQTNEPAFYAGAHLVFFFDKSLAFEGRAAYIRHRDNSPLFQGSVIDNILIPITFGFRFYPDIKNAPRPIAIANPYLAAGAGLYLRRTGDPKSGVEESTNNTGAYLGGGLQFLIYRRHIYLGTDLRYHLVYFDDEAVDINNNPDARSGNYFSTVFSLTYNF